MPVTTQVVTNVLVMGNGPMRPIVSAASETPSVIWFTLRDNLRFSLNIPFP